MNPDSLGNQPVLKLLSHLSNFLKNAWVWGYTQGYVCVHVCTHVCVCACGGLRTRLGCHPHKRHLPPPTQVSTLAWRSPDRIDWTVSEPRALPVSTSPVLSLEAHHHIRRLFFSLRVLEIKLGLLSSITNALSTEHSTQPPAWQ